MVESCLQNCSNFSISQLKHCAKCIRILHTFIISSFLSLSMIKMTKLQVIIFHISIYTRKHCILKTLDNKSSYKGNYREIVLLKTQDIYKIKNTAKSVKI